jgi:hypothetical protein
MDNETAEKFAELEAVIARLEEQLAGMTAPKPEGKVIMLKQVASGLGISVETLRRRVLRDPTWEKRAGRWVKRHL